MTQDTESRKAVGQPVKGRSRLGLTAVPVLIFAVLAAVFGASLMTGDPSKIPSALIGKPAPDMPMPPLAGLVRDGQSVPSFAKADLARGKVSVVNFWASWCAPCLQEHPLLIELAKTGKAAVYGVNYKDPNGGGLRFLERLGNPYRAVGVDANGRVAIEWGVYGMPETFVVDGRGIIAYKHIGPLTPDVIQRDILPAIEKAAALSGWVRFAFRPRDRFNGIANAVPLKSDLLYRPTKFPFVGCSTSRRPDRMSK